MLTFNVTGTADQDAILEALSLIDGITVEIVPQTTPTVPASFSKLPPKDSQRQRVLLFFLRASEAQTRDDVKLGLNLDDGSADPRCLELIQGGFLVETDTFKTTRNGKRAELLAPTDKARRMVNLAPRTWFPHGIRTV